MASKSSVLVVANRTALSIGLEAALRARVESGPASFTLVVPLGMTDDAASTAQRMARQLRDVGFDVTGRACDSDPFNAVLEVWSPAEFDEIIVSTLPASTSRWMQAGLLRRIERHTGALVRHVEAREALTPRPVIREPAEARSRAEKRGALASVMHRFPRPGAAH
jgi:hypothetical protein